MSTSYLKKRFRRLCERAGVAGPHAHIHTTRHTVAVALRLAGCRIVDIASFLGHALPSTTFSVYSTPSFEQLLGVLRLPWLSGAHADVDADHGLLRALSGVTEAPPPPPARAAAGGAT